MLKFDKVTFIYPDKTTAVKDISFEAEAGEFIFLIGHTGAGKTTLLKLLLGEVSPTKGQIVFEDKDITKMKSWERQLFRQQIGVIKQGVNLIPELSVRENLILRLELAGIKPKTKTEFDNKVSRVLKRFGLSNKANHFPTQLSGGERQKAALARAVILEPLLIFADEPTGNLDPESSIELVQELNQINREGVLVIMATHDKEVVDKMKHRVITLKKGRIVSDKRKASYVSG